MSTRQLVLSMQNGYLEYLLNTYGGQASLARVVEAETRLIREEAKAA